VAAGLGQFVLDFDAGEIAERAGVKEEAKVAMLSCRSLRRRRKRAARRSRIPSPSRPR
jgi:hypothetical protein